MERALRLAPPWVQVRALRLALRSVLALVLPPALESVPRLAPPWVQVPTLQ